MLQTALHFSGGKDSIVILDMYTPFLDSILVTWVNTGAAYPSTIELMKSIKKAVPHFLEIQSDQPAQIEEYGYPSDIVPAWLTFQGRQAKTSAAKSIKIQDPIHCCGMNIWLPMHRKMKELGITTIIRGQRLAEDYKSPIRNGHTEDGITYIFPIEDWTDEQVFDYIREKELPLPAYYSHEKKSHDCWSCTAFLDEDRGRINNLPEMRKQIVVNRLVEIKKTVMAELNHLDSVRENEW